MNSPNTPPPDAVIMQLAFGPMLAQALAVAAKLGIADLLKDGPKAVSALAEATGSHERSLFRILRSLASAGVFHESAPHTFAQTNASELLRSDLPASMRDVVLFSTELWHWKVWSDMSHSVRTGEPAWEHVHGKSVFDWFGENAEPAALFNATMTSLSVGVAAPILASYDFSGLGTLVDIAGGHGYLLAQALKANPGVKGILFDVPSVLAGADALLAREGVADRVTKATGDFFKAVPAGADAYMMKHIIHDWDDEKSRTILKNINAAMPAHGKVLIIEQVVPDGDAPHPSKLLDLEMLVSPGGVERTPTEYGDLLASAGLRMMRIVPTPSPFSIIEAVRA